jgi:1-acyl-sn-glycerol-3-phosphate acyltransferase
VSPGRRLRASLRLGRLGAELAGSALRFTLAGRGGPRGIHELSRRLLRTLRVRLEVAGPVPRTGLVVCNHLGYLDIVVLAATAPTVFVAKSEVRSWPVFGWFAARGGTIFVERSRPASLVPVAESMEAALRAGARVVLFPEGTSSGGETVLPFKSSLLAAAGPRPVGTAAIAYALGPDDGRPAEAVCYWGEMSLPAHLWQLLGRRRIFARVAFGLPAENGGPPDRKALARDLHARVQRLRAQAEESVRAAERRPLHRGAPPTAGRASAPPA